jgi:predicted lipid-binding transport protein (Tim44 family)
MLARVGGGGGYSGGGGGDGGGGDAGLVFALVRLLLWLVFRHPLIGIPVLIVVVIVVLNLARSGRLQLSTHERPRVFEKVSGTVSPAALNLTPVRSSDPSFSEPAFLDFAQLVFVRAHEMRGTGTREPLAPWMAPEAIDKLFADRVELTAVGEVIVGAARIQRAFTDQGFVVIEVSFEANVTETRRDESAQVLCEERWAFRRKAGVVSPPPSRLRALGCPGCGSTLEPKPDGTCASCGTPRCSGLAIWEVASIPYANRRPLTAPELRVRGGGVEEGTERPTRYDPRLQASRRAFDGRHPDHAWPAFETRVREVFLGLQAAWSTQDWDKARSDETDALYQTHRFWMERYRAFGLRNRVEGAEVSRVLLTRIDTDAFYESITVRIFASARDWTERADGTVVSGKKNRATNFSEYWTFLRGTTPDTAIRSCPSCAAPLDASLGPAAVCPSCGAKLESASARWVVSRIEQD